jgi:phosphoglycolate phosphatase-like HAD superfamily hydrolase
MLHDYKDENKYDVLVDCFKVLDQESLEIYKHESFDLCLGMPDVLIEVRKRGWNNGILTGNTYKRMEMKLSRIIDLFDPNLIFECKLGDSRENIAKRASELLASKRNDNNIIVGDTPRDISVAKEFGFQVVSVATGKFTTDALEKFKPHLLVKNFKHDFKNFIKFIDRFNN